MAKVYSNEKTSENEGKHVYGGYVGGRMRRYRAVVKLDGQASGDIIELVDIPAIETFAFGVLYTSVSLGTATLSIGTADDADEFMAAKTVTSADTPVFFGTSAAAGKDTACENGVRTVTATVGTAALPASGTLVVDVYTSGV